MNNRWYSAISGAVMIVWGVVGLLIVLPSDVRANLVSFAWYAFMYGLPLFFIVIGLLFVYLAVEGRDG